MREIIKVGNSFYTKEGLNAMLQEAIFKAASVEVHKYIMTPHGVKMTTDLTALHEVKEAVTNICSIIHAFKGTGFVSHDNVMQAASLYSTYCM